jgi:hypothetical protein
MWVVGHQNLSYTGQDTNASIEVSNPTSRPPRGHLKEGHMIDKLIGLYIYAHMGCHFTLLVPIHPKELWICAEHKIRTICVVKNLKS